METKKIRTGSKLLGALLTAGFLFALSSNASAVAVFGAETEANLTLSTNSNLSISIVDTFFDVFEAGIGDSVTMAEGTAVPTVDAIAGDPPLDLPVGEAIKLSLELGGAATSTPADPFSIATASVLGTAVLRIQSASDAAGEFDFNLDWVRESFLSVDHAGEMAGIDLELVVAAYDDLGNTLFDQITVYSVSLDTALGDAGESIDSGVLSIGGAVGAGEAWNLIVDLFAFNGYAESTLPPASVPVPAPIVLLVAGLVALVSRQHRTIGT